MSVYYYCMYITESKVIAFAMSAIFENIVLKIEIIMWL